MHFYWLLGSPWPLAGYFIAFIIAAFLALDARSFKEYFGLFLIGFTFLAAIGNVITAMISPLAETSTLQGSYVSAARELGLESGKEYPLVVGDAGFDTDGTARVTPGLFYASAVTDLRPTNVITLSFSHNGTSWPITIPTADGDVSFHLKNNAPATMKVILLDWMYDPNDFVGWNDPVSKCHWGISNLAVGCVRWHLNPAPTLTSDAVTKGLPPIVGQGIYHADITLPTKLYNELFGFRQP